MEDNSQWPVDAEWDTPAVELNDAKSLRAFAHPLRIELIEALRAEGPLTATRAAELVGDTPSNCSFHLRALAGFGLVERCAGPDRRQRPWQIVRGVLSFGEDGTAESRVARTAAVEVMHAHAIKALSRWMQQSEDAPAEWQDAWFDANSTISVTAEELARIGRQMTAILKPYSDRRQRRPAEPGEAPVRVATYAFPIRIPQPVSDS
jgi:predicted transcriptional regulator